MARRKVNRLGKKNGDIIALCNENEDWSPCFKLTAIREIENGIHSYYVRIPGRGEVDIQVVTHPYFRRCLRTDPNSTAKNYLEDLPQISN